MGVCVLRHRKRRTMPSRTPLVTHKAILLKKKKKKKKTAAVKYNDFQLGIDIVRNAVDQQRGVRIQMPLSAFTGYWQNAPVMCTGTLLESCHEGHFVAKAHFDCDTEGLVTMLTASSLMLKNTHVSWRKPNMDPKRHLEQRCLVDAKHTHAFERAKEMYTILISHMARLGIPLKKKKVLTLDGIATNQLAGNAAMDAMNIPHNMRLETLTLEMNAICALSQRVALGLGNKVRFTGADPDMSTKSLLIRTAPTMESVIMTSNDILSEADKRSTVWVNFDYCGGPPKSHNTDDCAAYMSACIAHLVSVLMVTVTIARRNHSHLDKMFDAIFPPPYGFVVHKVYTTNHRVLCKMYIRDHSITRRLRIPGKWWVNADSSWKNKTFDGIVVAKSSVYVPHDDQTYCMRDDAIATYAISECD